MEEIQKAAKADPVYQQAWDQVEKEATLEGPALKARKGKEGKERIEDGLLYRQGMLWIPEGRTVQAILESEHDTKVAGHMGQDKTIELVRRNFWWPKMNERILDYVRSCPECQQN